jgi:hypothetical protein
VASDAVVIGSVGILTSGVVGPAVAARWARERQERDFRHDLELRHEEDLRGVLEHAAEILGPGVTNLRRAVEAARERRAPPDDVQEWARQVHLARERLLLRLSDSDAVVARYTEARDLLTGLAELQADAHIPARDDEETSASEGSVNATIEQFEAKRSEFLAAARERLTVRSQPDR